MQGKQSNYVRILDAIARQEVYNEAIELAFCGNVRLAQGPFEVSAAVVGNVLGFSPVAAETDIQLNSIGRVETATIDLLTGTIYGPEKIYYKGNPTIEVDLLSITSDLINAN